MTQFILTALAIFLVLFILLKVLKVSVKLIIKLAINALVGFIIIFLLNIIPGVAIAYTWFNGLLVGIFGIPGALVALILSFIL